MSLTTRVGLLAGATALTFTGVAAAASTDASNEQLRAEIAKLNSRLAELEGRGDNWLNEQRASEIRGLVHDVLADADTRSSLLGSGMAAGYDHGFTLGSADGNFALRMNGQLQVRWIFNHQPDIDEAGGDRWSSGFENSRTRLWFSGHVVNPDWTYMIQGDFGDIDGGFSLLDAYISYNYGDGLSVTAGQFKLPLLRETLVDSRYQQAVERSLVDAYFSGGRSQGIMLGYEQDAFRFWGAFSDGAGQANSGALMRTTEYALTARAEMLLNGTWKQFHEFRSAPGEETGMLIGLAAHWEDGEYGTAANETEIFQLTADASMKFGGINVFGAYIFRHIDVNGGGNFSDHAFVIQAGFHLTDEWELFGRYEHVVWDSDIDADDISVLTAGVNHYFAGHQAKFTADLGYAINEIPGTFARQGYRNDLGTDDGQVVIRTQLQLLF